MSDKKIMEALEKQGKAGSPYANTRNMSMTVTPLPGVQIDYKQSESEANLSAVLDVLKKDQKKADQDYFKVDNLIFPSFKKGRKRVLSVDNASGKIGAKLSDKD